ncbi:MAG: hypothetical protein HDR11_04760 [Lachnospiraceae bacterium]|nr:hypothetical protein [Lachnospiraceae bacterium]
MLKKFLTDTFGYNEPIFINELCVPNMSDSAKRQAVKRLSASGFLKRYDTGIYYIPKPSKLLETSYLDPYLVITRKYVKNNAETYGYITGASFANQLGLTTQMPAVLEIVTNKEATKGRVLTIGGQTVRIKRPILPITDSNAPVLQFLDTLSQAERYSELNKSEMINRLKAYLRQRQFTQKQLSDVATALTGNTAKKLIEWGMIYEFAS